MLEMEKMVSEEDDKDPFFLFDLDFFIKIELVFFSFFFFFLLPVLLEFFILKGKNGTFWEIQFSLNHHLHFVMIKEFFFFWFWIWISLTWLCHLKIKA
jgi:hypothetical protein